MTFNLNNSRIDQVLPFTDENRLPVETKPTYENGNLSAFGIPLMSNLRVFKEFRYNNATLNTELVEKTKTGTGSFSLADNSSLQLSTGATASSAIEIKTKTKHKYVSGIGNRGQWSIILGDTGVLGNIREWGYKSDSNNDGAFFRLDGTTLYFVLLNGGVETTISSSTWDKQPVLNPNGNLWYIAYEWQGVGNFFLYFQQQLVHTVRFQGTSLKASMEDPDLPFHYKNQNTTNTSNVILKNPCSVMMYEGNEAVQLKDENDIVAAFTSDKRIQTAAFGVSLIKENFANNVFETTTTWTVTPSGSAAYNVADSILDVSVTAASGDSLKILYKDEIAETVGALGTFGCNYSFGTTLQANNIREWGYQDKGESNGVFFRLDGTTFYLVFKKTGVETTKNITDFLPDGGFHKYTITQEGLDNITVYIDGTKIYETTGTILVGDKLKSPYFYNNNTAALAGVPSNSRIVWLNFLDSAGSITSVIGESGNVAEITNSRRLLVSSETPPAGPGETPVSRNLRGQFSGTTDDVYVIPAGKTLEIRSVSFGVENNGAGMNGVVFSDPNGNGTGMSVVPDGEIITDGNSRQNQISQQYPGNGTAAIRMRIEQLTGGNYRSFGSWVGVLV